jgi:hypothetical protein
MLPQLGTQNRVIRDSTSLWIFVILRDFVLRNVRALFGQEPTTVELEKPHIYTAVFVLHMSDFKTWMTYKKSEAQLLQVLYIPQGRNVLLIIPECRLISRGGFEPRLTLHKCYQHRSLSGLLCGEKVSSETYEWQNGHMYIFI